MPDKIIEAYREVVNNRFSSDSRAFGEKLNKLIDVVRDEEKQKLIARMTMMLEKQL